MVVIPAMAVAAADKPGTVLRPAAAKRRHRRRNVVLAFAGAFTVQKQAEEAPAKAHGRFGNHQRYRQKSVGVVLQILAHIQHAIFRIEKFPRRGGRGKRHDQRQQQLGRKRLHALSRR